MECQFFGNVKVDGENFNYSTFEVLYDVILPLRVLSLRETPQWKVVINLKHHLKELQQRPSWKDGHKFVIDYITSTLKLNVSEDTILTILAIDQANSFDVDFSGYKVRLLHPLSSLMEHDCLPNVARFYSGLYCGNLMQCRAAFDIKKGEKLTLSYLDLLTPLEIRQKLLKEKYFLDCKCTRCQDPSDLATNGNSLLCQKCPDGVILPGDKTCTKCKATQENCLEAISDAFKNAKEVLNDPEQWTVEVFELFLSKYGRILHPDHVIMVQIKHKLSGFYGRLPGYSMLDMQMNPALLERKLKLGEESMKCIEKLQPGLGTIKALQLYENHLPIFMKAQIEMGEEPMATPEQKQELNRAVQILEQSIDLLKYEMEGTFENSLYHGAQGQLAQLKGFIADLW